MIANTENGTCIDILFGFREGLGIREDALIQKCLDVNQDLLVILNPLLYKQRAKVRINNHLLE